MEAALDRFRAANTQVLGVSVDSIHSHLNWAFDGGGISFPLLADFEPKGSVASSFGHYLADKGITDRATVIVDKDGIVRYSMSVTPSGQRDVYDLIAECEKVNSSGGDLPSPTGVAAGTSLFVKSSCGPSRRARLALDNLHLTGVVEVKNVSESESAAAELERVGGKNQAPCLILDGKAIYESAELIQELAHRAAPIC